jgi:hypothetical protein
MYVYTYLHITMVKSSINFFGYFSNFTKKLPNRRKFAHSGHPDCNTLRLVYCFGFDNLHCKIFRKAQYQNISLLLLVLFKWLLFAKYLSGTCFCHEDNFRTLHNYIITIIFIVQGAATRNMISVP